MNIVAFLTNNDYPEGSVDDQPAMEALRRRGVEVVPMVWNDSRVTWDSFDAVIVRSVWDYHLAPDTFSAFLDARTAQRIRFFNPAQLIRWNMDKHYLRDLAKQGVTIIPSVWVERGQPVSIAEVMRQQNWTEAVIKPTVSAGAWRTFRVRADEPLSPDVEALIAERNGIIQQFRPEIISEGEWSFVCFDGVYSHAVLKKAKQGDYRVQGGDYEGIDAPTGLVAQAAAVVQAVDDTPLYARVDGVFVGQQFQLMELELFEPWLFLRTHPEAADRFAEAIVRRLG